MSKNAAEDCRSLYRLLFVWAVVAMSGCILLGGPLMEEMPYSFMEVFKAAYSFIFPFAIVAIFSCLITAHSWQLQRLGIYDFWAWIIAIFLYFLAPVTFLFTLYDCNQAVTRAAAEIGSNDFTKKAVKIKKNWIRLLVELGLLILIFIFIRLEQAFKTYLLVFIGLFFIDAIYCYVFTMYLLRRATKTLGST